MTWLHSLLVIASAAEVYGSTGTYVLPMIECAACLWQFVVSAWVSVE